MEKPVLATAIDSQLARFGLALVCPLCKRALGVAAGGYGCAPCRRSYPVVDGIPDFRIEPDRFIGMELDREKGRRVLALTPDGDFAQALQAYWSITNELAGDLAARHQAHQLVEEEIGGQTLAEIERLGGPGVRAAVRGSTLLDVGCGSAGLLAAAAKHFDLALGVDDAFRWLVLARLRLNQAGLQTPLICANAEYLPFPEGAFGLVTATDLVEHVSDPLRALEECRRVAAPGGYGYIATNNRYSLGLEPHVRLWGVGFVPRRWQRRFVGLFRNHAYDKVRLLSSGELRRLLKQAGWEATQPSPAPVYAGHLGGTSAGTANLYNAIRRWPGLGWLLAKVGPRVQFLCRRGAWEL